MTEPDHSIKTVQSKGPHYPILETAKSREQYSFAQSFFPVERLSRYPKHVWSPSGGWYAQPANWKANTAVMGLVIFGITAMAWSISAEREYRTKFPEPGRFFPSR